MLTVITDARVVECTHRESKLTHPEPDTGLERFLQVSTECAFAFSFTICEQMQVRRYREVRLQQPDT